jgi:very-short-patch-repair endonuclease
MKRIKGGSHQDSIPATFRNAQFLRKRMTRHELLVWARIRNKQIHQQKFRRQHPIGRYILDFFCIECKLSIEVDGESHSSNIQMGYDNERTAYLEQ